MSSISPIIAYHDLRAAIDFLCDAFGFKRHAVHESPDVSCSTWSSSSATT